MTGVGGTVEAMSGKHRTGSRGLDRGVKERYARGRRGQDRNGSIGKGRKGLLGHGEGRYVEKWSGRKGKKL